MSNRKPRKPGRGSKPPAARGVKFINLSAEEARGDTVPLTATQKASQVYLSKLYQSQKQHDELRKLYEEKKTTDQSYELKDEEAQIAAASWLAAAGLELDARKGLGNRWTIWWTQGSGERSGEEVIRKLFQCDCGYSHESRNTKSRKNPVDFTGCLAHGEVMYQKHTGKVLLIRGYFEHNQPCRDAFLARIPPIPLHPSVFEVALRQLRSGAELTDVQDTNRKMFHASAYSGQPLDMRQSVHRWLLRKSDTRSLYRQFNRLRGINVVHAAHVNVDNWLDPTSPAYNPAFAAAVFHYSARATQDDRFEVCIATKEMHEAAWKYAHESQIVLDGTFGLCDKKVLLFIVMGVDEKKRGVPLAFLLFSAPSGNQQTSSGYNTEILTRLLSRWRTSLGVRSGVSFSPRVAITDTDLKERGALLNVFPDLWLLLCKFHLRQSWRNHRARVLKGNSPYHDDVRARLRRLELSLIETTAYKDAHALVAAERAYLEGLRAAANAPVEQRSSAVGGIEHLEYLSGYWLSEALWRSWSEYGRQAAARLLGCSVDGVLPTTNHLESFNGVLKRKHIRRWQRGGRRLRLDVLLHIFVFSVLPSIFEARALEAAEDERTDTLIKRLPGGEALLEQRAASALELGEHGAHRPSHVYAYMPDDTAREENARLLLKEGQISVPTFQDQSLTFEFDCFSSLAMVHDLAPLVYTVSIGLGGSARCSCRDFCTRDGAACKHIRAGLLRLDGLRETGLRIPVISIPRTRSEARTLYGAEHGVPSTEPDNGNAVAATRTRQDASPQVTHPSPSGSLSPASRAARFIEAVLCESGDAFATPASADGRFVTETSPGALSDVEMDTALDSLGPDSDYLSESEENEHSPALDVAVALPAQPIAATSCAVASPQGTLKTGGAFARFPAVIPAPPSLAAPPGHALQRSSEPTERAPTRPPGPLMPDGATLSAIAAVHRQVMARVLHELESEGPKLREFSDLLKGVTLVESEVPRVQAAKENLDVLSEQLSVMLRVNEDDRREGTGTHPGHSQELISPGCDVAGPAPPSTPPCRYRKRRASSDMFILPPSPEKSQKRHDSHSIH